MKIVVDEKIKLFSNIVNELDCFENIEFIYINSKEIDNNILIDADALFIRSTTIVNESLLKNTRVKLVGSATGIANVPSVLPENNKSLGADNTPLEGSKTIRAFEVGTLLATSF